jgi:hypothetical protein
MNVGTHRNRQTGPGSSLQNIPPEVDVARPGPDLGVRRSPVVELGRRRESLGLIHLSGERGGDFGIVDDGLAVRCEGESVNVRDETVSVGWERMSTTGDSGRGSTNG